MSVVRRRLGAALTAVLTAALAGTGLAACDSPSGSQGKLRSTPSAELGRFYEQQLRWSACGGRFECAKLEVPLDYAAPQGKTIRISVVRRPATGKRIGSLILNPGGPGGSGITYAMSAALTFSQAVRDRFDIVGFDPRGVDASSPIRCVGDAELDRFVAMDASPDSRAEAVQLDQASRQFAVACGQRAADLLPHLSTRDIARDMDVLRVALGDDRLYYLGKSWGTFLGATYAELFPRNVGRMVLDGAVDPKLGTDDIGRAQARGFERELANFIDFCVRSDCPLGDDRRAAFRRLDQLLASLDRIPIPTADGRRLNQTLALYGITAPLYDDSTWPALRDALASALAGDGTDLLRLADEYFSRDPDGRYRHNIIQVLYAVNCIDRPVAPASSFPALEPSYRAASPRFGPAVLWGNLPCAYWPVKAVDRPHAISAPGTPPILVVGTRNDPATPYAWAVSLADQLPHGVLLTYEGDGHTAYNMGNQCIDQAVDSYLITGRPPADGTRCE
ncbi:proteinase [Carbonactinospora thermoautotrophica]|uniref:alpha/beta hydrolase n=1 Tax=Carbonactinospora thermoautotrophica TaxID=1469144 RepID=UPI00226F54E5|nr:alpha/beta hydrolase [Carbonactinospora thermoautotrophica]MCX9191443.1 proteinase [Carbonactinospora thermoautotrophica]